MSNPNTSSFWDKKNQDSFDKLITSPIYQFKIKYIMNLIDYTAQLLNIGVGNGYLETLIYSRDDRTNMYGIDISKKSIDRINKKVKGNFKVADAKRIPYKSLMFDTILALDVLEHFTFRELRIVMNEILRVMKYDGRLIVSVPINENHTDSFKNKHLYHFNEENINMIFNKLGLKIISSKSVAAFRSFFTIKNIINSIFKFRKNNLIILICKKI